MTSVLKKPVLTTRFDSADGSLGARRLAVLVIVMLLLGGAIIFTGQLLVANDDTWEATVTGVAAKTVNFTFDEDSAEIEVASYPAGMDVDEGDRVLIRIDEDEGNFVERVVD